jgi:phytoene synthase
MSTPSSNSLDLAGSYDYCRNLARVAARNFYYGFRLLPNDKRDALCALYAFMRGVDDISDEAGEIPEKRRRLAERRAEMDRALAGEIAGNPVWPAFRDTVERYKIPVRYLHDLISGAEMDLTVQTYETFEGLREYCYRVAGTVGLCCVHVFGFTDPRAPEYAERLGIAFQITNILRDVRADYDMGRVYLPREDLRQFSCVPAEEIPKANASEAFRSLVKFEAERAREFYLEGSQLIRLIEEDSRSALWALSRIYAGILEKIEQRNYDVLPQPPARLSSAEKLWILARAKIGWRGPDNVVRMGQRDRRRLGGPFGGRRAG